MHRPRTPIGDTGVVSICVPRRLTLVPALVGLAALVISSCASTPESGEPDSDRPTSTLPTPRVDSIRAGDVAGAVLDVVDHPTGVTTSAHLPSGTSVQTFAYATIDVAGDVAAATAMLVTPPDVSTASALVVWAHPTRGSADACAPSRQGPQTIAEVAELVDAGFAVVAPDYEGLGVPGPHPYLVGDSAGRSVLDSARAALSLLDHGPPDAPAPASLPVALWGFSQGGHAAAFAAQMAPTYAPDLDLVGAVLAAPVTNVVHFAERAEARADQQGVLLTILVGFAAAYPQLDLHRLLTAEAVALAPEVDQRCIGEVVEAARSLDAVLADGPLRDDPLLVDLLAHNTPGQVGAYVPVLVVQGGDDDIVDPADTAALVQRWCALDVSVQHVQRPGQGHGVEVADVLIAWLSDRFDGAPAPSTC